MASPPWKAKTFTANDVSPGALRHRLLIHPPSARLHADVSLSYLIMILTQALYLPEEPLHGSPYLAAAEVLSDPHEATL
jgi:hypothetical protein